MVIAPRPDWVAHASWVRLGTATWAAAMIAMLVLLALGAGVAAKRVPQLTARMALVALVTAIATSIGFIAQLPEMDGAELGRGVWLYAAGIVGGLAAAIPVAVRRA